jgi:hypothetical protein
LYRIKLSVKEAKTVTNLIEDIKKALEGKKNINISIEVEAEIVKQLNCLEKTLKDREANLGNITPEFGTYQTGQIAAAILAGWIYLKEKPNLANEPLMRLWAKWSGLIESNESTLNKDDPVGHEERMLQFYGGFANIGIIFDIPIKDYVPELKSIVGRPAIKEFRGMEAVPNDSSICKLDGFKLIAATGALDRKILKILLPPNTALIDKNATQNTNARPLQGYESPSKRQSKKRYMSRKRKKLNK